ncbi:SAVED domain-containing protein [Stenotrophomonas geniculata]|uniref:SAVED domain-containing protein n=1 Tax=Stenotrophomonas geniculata TaxID=86188 RepID=UPI00070928BE|nr:SAVED domain-containing protein [Stenotrophomonas geniculata]KRG46291.1 2-methylthioadenine synthetase [Stenotrophomonas geniculata ATCC 19374 = JCM 13324]MBN5091113.1 SAVED domain-containing protein [Stenotrophomonas maltophilia]
MINYFIKSLIDWVFRRRSPGVTLIRAGVPLFGLVLVGLTFGITIPTSQGPFTFSWDSSGSSGALSWGVFAITCVVVLLGVGLVVRDIRRESRKKVIVIEARGLRDWQGQPLAAAVPSSILGHREQVIVDVRQGVVDGQIVSPEAAVRRISSLPDDIARRCGGLDRSDLSFVLGGLAPVPLLFLLGVIVDDESNTVIMDWDRQMRAWRGLSAGEDDGNRFVVAGLDTLQAGATRVALCVSASYDVLDVDVQTAEAGTPVIRMDLEGRGTDTHWSELKQQQLAQQFLDTVMSLARNGITDITLFLAAPASLALRLGMLYDKRNLPRVEVNQYEQANPKRFPWMVRMPVAGVPQAEVMHR